MKTRNLIVAFEMSKADKPDETTEGNITLPMLPEIADTVLKGNVPETLDTLLTALAQLQGYDGAEVLTVQEAD